MKKKLGDAFEQTLKILGARSRSRAQVRAALLRRGYFPEACEAAECRAAELGYLDDWRVAIAWAREALSSGRSPSAVTSWLISRGIVAARARAAVDEVCAELHLDELALARAALRQRRLSGVKAARFLTARGFAEEVIRTLLDLPET